MNLIPRHCCFHRRKVFLLVLLVLLGILSQQVVSDVEVEQEQHQSSDDGGGGSGGEQQDTQQQQEKQEQESPPKKEEVKTPPPKKADKFNVQDHMDWGSYYDPQNVFCGLYDCYRILGFDYESFGKNIPDTKVITKRYRSLSREWHPDKSKHKDAKERFVKIARAYEVLTDNEQRKEYDFMRYNQEAYFQKYGSSVLWTYAPKSDATYIIIALFLLVNWFTWIAQKQKWQRVADRLIQASVEDWSPSQGGTTESKQLREEAMKLFTERQEVEKEAAKANGNDGKNVNKKELKSLSSTGSIDNKTTPTKSKGKGKGNKNSKGEKISGKEKKRLEQENLKPIVTELVHKIDNFGAGFHKPTWKDLFVVNLMKFPLIFSKELFWQMKYYTRRLQNKVLNDEEQLVLTERAVGHVSWELASEDERKDMISRELWKMDNLVEWKEEQEVKTWSKADQKYYHKMKKKGFKGREADPSIFKEE